MIHLPPIPGSPDVVEAFAESLREAARSIGAAQGALQLVRPGARWQSPAGQAFEARVQATPRRLDLMAQRYAGAAAALRTFAAEFREAQRICTREAVAHAELAQSAEHLMAAIDARGMPATEGERVEVGVMERRRQEAILLMQASERRYTEAHERFREADRHCARALEAIAHDSLDDTAVYRAMTGTRDTVQAVADNAAAAALIFPEAAPLAAPVGFVAGVIGTGTAIGVRIAYDEGSWRSIATSAGTTALGQSGALLKNSATARNAITGAHRAPGRPMATELLVKGGRDYLRNPPWRIPAQVESARLRLPALLGPRAPLSQRLRASARHALDKAVVNDWRAATANGRKGQVMLGAAWTAKSGAKAVETYPKARELVEKRRAQGRGGSW